MAYLNKFNNLNDTLCIIYYFVDEFIKGIVHNLQFALSKPHNNMPPRKKHNLSISELVTLGIFRYFTNITNWKAYHKHLYSFFRVDFPNLPDYSNFLTAMNKLSWLALLLLQHFCSFFKKITHQELPKFVDSSKLEVCHIKREFTHKVCKDIARKSKSTMGWFYGFKLHIICNKLMQILSFRISPANLDDRKGLDRIWNDIFGMIIADAGYIGADWQKKACYLGKLLLTGVKANMKKLLTFVQFELLKMRQCVETVFSVLKLRMGMQTTLPRSPLGYFAHYIWCLTAYQLDKYLQFLFNTPLLA